MTERDAGEQPVHVDPELVERITRRRAAILDRIAELTDRPVRLVAVTKGHPVEVAAAALAAGLEDLGENYAQELAAKADRLRGAAPTWHFVGRLQRNKVRSISAVTTLWHTVDRPSLADEIARRAPGAEVLVQLDLAGLEGRGGCAPDDAPALVQHCQQLELSVRGLMGVGPPGAPELARPGFRRLVEMADDLGLVERSIGMSGDLDVAVEEGATLVRLGTALVGARPPRAAGTGAVA